MWRVIKKCWNAIPCEVSYYLDEEMALGEPIEVYYRKNYRQVPNDDSIEVDNKMQQRGQPMALKDEKRYENKVLNSDTITSSQGLLTAQRRREFEVADVITSEPQLEEQLAEISLKITKLNFFRLFLMFMWVVIWETIRDEPEKITAKPTDDALEVIETLKEERPWEFQVTAVIHSEPELAGSSQKPKILKGIRKSSGLNDREQKSLFVSLDDELTIMEAQKEKIKKKMLKEKRRRELEDADAITSLLQPEETNKVLQFEENLGEASPKTINRNVFSRFIRFIGCAKQE